MSLEYRWLEMTEKERIHRPILASFIAALGPLSFGYCFSYSSSALLDLISDNADSSLRLTASQGSWFSVSKPSFSFATLTTTNTLQPVLQLFYFVIIDCNFIFLSLFLSVNSVK